MTKFYKYFYSITIASACLLLVGYYGHESGKLLTFKTIFLNKIDFKESETVTLAFPKKARYTRPDIFKEGEFEWHGKSLDVINFNERNDSLYVKCYIDEAESRFKAQNPWLAHQNTGTKTNHFNKKTKYILFVVPNTLTTDFKYFNTKHYFCSNFNSMLRIGFQQVPNPPPNC